MDDPRIIYGSGCWLSPLKNMKVNWDDEIPNRWKHKMKPTNKMNAHTYVTGTDVQTHAKQRFPFQYKVLKVNCKV